MASVILSAATAAHCFDVQFHPREPLLFAATVTGEVEVLRFDTAASSTEQVRVLTCHEDSCRAVAFLHDREGDTAAPRLLSTSADASVALTDVETAAQIWSTKIGAGGNALLPLSRQRFVVGDDEGGIAVYDVRKSKPAVSYSENEDYIADMALGEDGQSLCAVSGDGTLAVYDLRKAGTEGLIAMSDFQEDEYLSVIVLRDGKKVVCGSQSGALAIFAWGDFGDQKDRIRGHPTAVDAMVKLTEEGILTGSSDGKIRVVSVYGQDLGSQVLGTLGEHGSLPLESLALSPDATMVASAAHEQPTVRLWSVAKAHKLLNAEEDVPEAGAAASAAGGDGEEEAEKDSDSSDEDVPKPKKRKKRRKQAGVAAERDKTASATCFFGDM